MRRRFSLVSAFILSAAVFAIPLSIVLLTAPALAQTAAPTCKTPAVIAKLKELRARILRYEKRALAAEILVDELREEQKKVEEKERNTPEKDRIKFGNPVAINLQKLNDAEEKLASYRATLDGLNRQYDALDRLPACEQSNPISQAVGPTNSLFSNTIYQSGSFSLTFDVGQTWTRYSSSYASTAPRLPADASSTGTATSICGGANYYYPLNASGTAYGGGLNICGETGGAKNLFDIVRHPGAGHVIADVNPGLRIEPFIGIHIPVPTGSGQSFSPNFVLLRMGPSFAQNRISISSNQTAGPGLLESASSSPWTTGFNLTAGISTSMCPSCFFGRPVAFNLLGKATWFPSSTSVTVVSRTFGFPETATINNFAEYGVQASFSTPLGGR